MNQIHDSFHKVMEEVQKFTETTEKRDAKVLIIMSINYFQDHGVAHFHFYPPGSADEEQPTEGDSDDLSHPG